MPDTDIPNVAEGVAPLRSLVAALINRQSTSLIFAVITAAIPLTVKPNVAVAMALWSFAAALLAWVIWMELPNKIRTAYRVVGSIVLLGVLVAIWQLYRDDNKRIKVNQPKSLSSAPVSHASGKGRGVASAAAQHQ